MRSSLSHAVLLALLTAAACAPVASAWGPPRSNGLGTQTLSGGSGPDYLRGAEGPDRVRGNGGGDLLTGDTGPDRVSGGSGSDTLTGGAGGDVLDGGPGNDIAFGGFGADRIDGGPGDDALDGNNDDDKLFGGAGNDVLHGGSGIDKIDGGAGDDRIFSDSGADLIAAREGDDTIVVDGANKAVVNCGPGNDTLYIAVAAEAAADYVGRGPQTRYTQCETTWITDALRDPNKGVTYLALDRGGKREGTARDDTLLGGPGPDALYGGAGNDVLWGLRQPNVSSGSSDILDAGSGDDTVYGGPGPQRILGGPGDDFLEGGIGDGTIAGGTGDDTIRLRGGGLTKVSAGAGNDTIYARGTARAQIRCGGGRDVAHADAGDRVARDCERIVGRAAPRAPAKPRASYADTIGATPGLAYWWRLGEQPPVYLFNPDLVDSKAGARASYFGKLGAPGVTDDANTSFEGVRNYQTGQVYFSGEPYITLGISNAILHGEFTYEAWYRSDDSGTPRGMLNDVYGSSSVAGVALVREASGALRAVITSGAGDPQQRIDVTTPPLNLPAFSWHHVALTRADDRVAIYVDGALKAETAATPIPLVVSSYSVGVGSRFSSYQSWEGGIDEIALYDRPLDAATVLAHATAGDDGLAPVARAEPAAGPLQPRSGVIHLTADKAGTSFRCSLDGAGYTPCRADYPLAKVPEGPHELRVLAMSRTGALQAVPTTFRFTIDAGLPGTVLAVRLAPLDDGRAIVTFGSDTAATFECRRGRSFPTHDAGYVPCSPPLDVTPGATFEVRAVDAAGNRDPNPASVLIPPAGAGFGYLPLIPTFAGSRAEARLSGEFSSGADFQCRIDARDWAACSSDFLLPILDAGAHRMQIRQPYGGALGTSAPMTWTVAPRPGDVAIAGLQMQLVIERSARLVRRAPRVRFALSHPAAVTVDVLRRGHKPAIRVAVSAQTGANLVKISARKLNALGEGRYTVRVTARGATGHEAVQILPLAIVPPLR